MYLLQRIVAKNCEHVVLARKFSTKAKTVAQVEGTPDIFPEKLRKKKHKTPPQFYIAKEETAQSIDKYIEPFLRSAPYDTVLEMNPGIGLMTQRLLKRKDRFRKVILIEAIDHFLANLELIEIRERGRVDLFYGDIVNIWKLAYQDKVDNGTRVQDLLQKVPRRAYNDEPNMMLFGAVGSYQFFKHLINSLVFQNSLLSWGRCEMFLIMPPPIYVEIGYLIYRSTTMLFQMMFEYRFIAQLPRDHFLPAQSEYTYNKSSKLTRVKSINPEHLYLVKIAPRRNFLDLCPPQDLPALWYFVKQNSISRRNRVIPNLEKFVPGCGPRLIVQQKKPESVQQLYPDESLENLPKFSVPCTTMNCRDFYPNMNIYTQFGDLTPSQMLTLFTQFRQWPEFVECSFMASLENSLLKMEASADDSIDDIGLVEEDDAVGPDDVPPTGLAAPEVKKSASSKRKSALDDS